MMNDEILKALIEGIIYIAPEPVTLDGILKVLEGEERERVKAKLDELVADYEQNLHGIQVRQVANGYKFSTKAEHHEILRKYVKSLKPPIRLSKPALETLAVIAYRQPVTMPEIEEIRGVDSGGVIHTLLEKKLVVTSGRKSVVGRPILYRTSKDFLVHFGLKDVGELPSLKEFEELAKRALGSEWATGEAPATASEAAAAPIAEGDAAVVEAAPEAPPEAHVPVAGEAAVLDNPVATEAAPAAAEESGAVSIDVTPEIPAEATPSVEEETAPRENPVAAEAPPATAEETGGASAEEPPSGERAPASSEPASAAPPPEPTPLALEEIKPGESQEATPPAGESTEN
jgi:segregation and condensation protein B